MKFIVFLVTTVSFLFAAVDINNASARELTSLKGVGEKRAASILAYRKQHCFKSVDEITLIKGIGKKTLEKNRDNMETGSCD
jgi:competence protein ComEA